MERFVMSIDAEVWPTLLSAICLVDGRIVVASENELRMVGGRSKAAVIGESEAVAIAVVERGGAQKDLCVDGFTTVVSERIKKVLEPFVTHRSLGWHPVDVKEVGSDAATRKHWLFYKEMVPESEALPDDQLFILRRTGWVVGPACKDAIIATNLPGITFRKIEGILGSSQSG